MKEYWKKIGYINLEDKEDPDILEQNRAQKMFDFLAEETDGGDKVITYKSMLNQMFKLCNRTDVKDHRRDNEM